MDFLEGPDNETFERIKKELGEDTKRFENNLKILEEWTSYQSHLPQNYDKRMLSIFLRSCKHDMEKTKKKIELYFTIKSAIPEIFQNRDPERKDILQSVCYHNLAMMPKLTPEGYRVSFHKVKTTNLELFKIDAAIARGSFIACLRTVSETPVAGDILVFDVSNLTPSYLALFTPIVRKALILAPSAYPNRVRQIHLFNSPPIIEKVVSLIKSLIKEKFRSRFHIHKNAEGLKKSLPLHCIPAEYGGEAATLEELSRRTHEAVVKNAEWFRAQENVKLLGNIPEKYRFDGEYGGGVEGTFRKLAID